MSHFTWKAASCLTIAALLTLPALLLSPPAQASGLRVQPLRLDLAASQTSAQVELTNFGNSPVPVQVSLVSWAQVDGKDSYTPSKDVFFAPPIVTVPAGGSTTVRFRLRAAPSKDAERAYRVYFQEVTPPAPANQGGMAFRLRLGVPLFIQPAQAVAPRLQLNGRFDGKGWALDMANTGKAHLKIHGMELYPANVDRAKPPEPLARITHSTQGANYLLPGSKHHWQVPMPGAASGPLVLLIRTDDYTGKSVDGMTPAGWVWLPLPAQTAKGTDHR